MNYNKAVEMARVMRAFALCAVENLAGSGILAYYEKTRTDIASYDDHSFRYC